jgi:hypothetical protein
MKKEEANEKRLSLIRVILDVSDEQIATATLNVDPDATTESHNGGSHPPDPPPPPPPGQ